ncbi:hypothetical protein AOL_s00088g46 [Orbilia oligospora ATCC 24927]|uniref:Chromo domain-containing protein n=1 Tax=Arthrobotrys oligospora (strain ATCC 24927 / CBS 115.81 / DSM 1491) TaxID=756982 RepID=G1XHT3_ARTOA|nr:hypothetical protein AOL_s00088g46 [Orbilia oligospora ATCC 24927]EGX47331.1 hypothetical protein AOL_s00088g46 [Orbilia oligospora ATCC 24927]
MARPGVNEGEFKDENRKSAGHLDEDRYQAKNRGSNGVSSVELVLGTKNTLAAHISPEGRHPKSERDKEPSNTEDEEQPQCRIKIGGSSNGPISLAHILNSKIGEDRVNAKIPSGQTKLNGIGCSLTYDKISGISSSCVPYLGWGKLDNVETEYEVESIGGSRVRRGQREYLVNWVGYGDYTWEPIGNLTNSQLAIDDYEHRHLSRKRRRDGPRSQPRKRRPLRPEAERGARYEYCQSNLKAMMTGGKGDKA